uniref:Uncharacterized protein n=1 Tax=Tanacetum cinerariifolium TaxID=118510 RepID=A0A6L2M392_TANCI|nr:hypothetical protein [Tanacetum cinerariifolium]
MKSSHKAKIKELKSRVEKLEEKNRSLIKELKSLNTRVKSLTIKEIIVDKEESSKQGRKITDIDADVEVNLKNVYNLDMAHEETVLKMVEVMEIAKIIINEVSIAGVELNAANEKPVSAAHTNITIAQPSEATKTTVDITTAPKAKGIVFHDKEESTTRIASSKSQSRQPDVVRKYQALKRKHKSVAQARKNMMIYLKNMAGYKMDELQDKESRAMMQSLEKKKDLKAIMKSSFLLIQET